MIVFNLQKFLEYTCINIINSIILTYLDIKDILKNINEMIYSPNIFKFSYKKLFYYIIKEFKNNLIIITTELFKIVEMNKYTFQKYVLNYSFIKFVVIYLCDIDITNFSNHIYNELDIYHILKNLIMKLIKFVNVVIIEYKNNYQDKVYVLNDHIKQNNKPSLIFFILDQIERELDINKMLSSELDNEVKLTKDLLDLIVPAYILSIIPFSIEEIADYAIKLIIKNIKETFYVRKVIKFVIHCLNLIYGFYYKGTKNKINTTDKIVDNLDFFIY